MDSNAHPRSQLGLLATLNACMFVFGVVLLLMGSFLPQVNAGGMRAGSLGSFPLAGILGATVLIGPVLDKMTAKYALVIALALVSGSLAFIPTLSGYAGIAAAALLYGFGGGILNTATNALVSTMSGSGRGAALNLLGFSFSLGALTSPLLMSVTQGRFSAASVLYVLSAASAAVLVCVLAQKFPLPARSRAPLKTLLKALNQPLVWIFGALLFFESGNENCMFVWAGKVMEGLARTAAQRAELALFALSASLGAGRLTAALFLNRLGKRNAVLLSSAITAAGAGEALAHTTFAGIITGFILIGFGMSSIYPTVLAMAGDVFTLETGTVFGAIITLSLLGGTAGPIAGGWAASAKLDRVLWVPLFAPAAVAILIVAGSKRSRRVTPQFRPGRPM
jgi:MFS transporter, FHS family, glucose/mannose:H+ symporter